MVRLFVAIELPPEHKLRLSTICSGLPGASWVDPGNFHVTLRFIGEVDEGMAADIRAELEHVRSPVFPLSIGGIDFFGTGDRVRTLYARVERTPPLTQLRERVEHALERAGLMPEGRRFTPHVTLARLRNADLLGMQRFQAAHNLMRLPDFTVVSFALVASYLTKSGSIYEDIADYPLLPRR